MIDQQMAVIRMASYAHRQWIVVYFKGLIWAFGWITPGTGFWQPSGVSRGGDDGNHRCSPC